MNGPNLNEKKTIFRKKNMDNSIIFAQTTVERVPLRIGRCASLNYVGSLFKKDLVYVS